MSFISDFRQEPEQEIELISIYRTGPSQSLAMFVISFLSIKWWFVIGGMIATVVFITNAYRLKELCPSLSKKRQYPA